MMMIRMLIVRVCFRNPAAVADDAMKWVESGGVYLAAAVAAAAVTLRSQPSAAHSALVT